MKFTQKKLTKKVKGIIKSDIMGSIALVSVLLNVFFMAGIVLFSGTSELDAPVYEAAVSNLCVDNYTENLNREVEEADGATWAKANFEIVCRSGSFTRYYENAVEAYLQEAY